MQYGRIVELTVSGLTIGEENSRIHAPSELHAPFLGPAPASPSTWALVGHDDRLAPGGASSGASDRPAQGVGARPPQQPTEPFAVPR